MDVADYWRVYRMINDEKELNRIVFDVYNSVLDMDYCKNESSKKRLLKLFRYIKTGYIFEVSNERKQMRKKNLFISTENIYDDLKVAIYTVSTGQYDVIYSPIYADPSIDYFIFTDQNLNGECIWRKMGIPGEIQNKTSLEQARYIKTHPHVFFSEYDYSIFIDGNIRITCDIKPLIYSMIDHRKSIAIHQHQVRDCLYDEARAVKAVGKASSKLVNAQMKMYKSEGFPKHYGLFETNVLIRKHNDEKCIRLMDTWWNEMLNWTKRDQLSFTYSLWKNNLSPEYVMSLGNNSRKNPYFVIDSHS